MFPHFVIYALFVSDAPFYAGVKGFRAGLMPKVLLNKCHRGSHGDIQHDSIAWCRLNQSHGESKKEKSEEATLLCKPQFPSSRNVQQIAANLVLTWNMCKDMIWCCAVCPLPILPSYDFMNAGIQSFSEDSCYCQMIRLSSLKTLTNPQQQYATIVIISKCARAKIPNAMKFWL